MKPLFVLLFLFASGTLNAQDTNEQLPDRNTVTIHEDARIALIVTHPAPTYTGKARGFRIQIYNGQDRNKANQIKLDFMQHHPGVRAYLVYNKPHFRVRVGNFTSRAEASALYHELASKYTCMIVPEIIYIAPPNDQSIQNDN